YSAGRAATTGRTGAVFNLQPPGCRGSVYLDAWYVKNWSMWNDIAILFKTISVVLRKDGAY
ncbi:sugar transferase, partial [Klebsiella pneumoniae]